MSLDLSSVASPARCRRPVASPASSEAEFHTPAQAQGGNTSPSSAEKMLDGAPSFAKQLHEAAGAGVKRKCNDESEDANKKAKMREAVENLEKSLLAAAPSASAVLKLIQSEGSSSTLASVIAKLASSVVKAKKIRRCDGICEGLRKERVAKLWPSIQERLEKQIRFGGDRVKLEVKMVPEEAPRQWLSEFEAVGQLKQLMTDSKAQLKFVANTQLGLGPIYNVSEDRELTFAYCKVSQKLVIHVMDKN